MDRRVLFASFALSAVSFAMYLEFFDILAPVIPGGSVRLNSGVFFVLPVFLLVGGQTLFGTWLTHFVVTVAEPEKRDALRAYLVTAAEIFMFSFFYVLSPSYGPYTFVVYFMPREAFGPLILPMLALWALATVLVTYLVLTRSFGFGANSRFGIKSRLLFSAAMLAMLIVIAD
jgi:hypothetical protein